MKVEEVFGLTGEEADEVMAFLEEVIEGAKEVSLGTLVWALRGRYEGSKRDYGMMLIGGLLFRKLMGGDRNDKP